MRDLAEKYLAEKRLPGDISALYWFYCALLGFNTILDNADTQIGLRLASFEMR